MSFSSTGFRSLAVINALAAPKADEVVVAAIAAALDQGLEGAAIVTKLRLAHFAAQAAHESAGFSQLVENLNYSAKGLRATWPSRFTLATAQAFARKPEQIANKVYAGRLGNGDTLSGDGWRYRGRGIFQVTGRANYRVYGQAIGLDIEANPDLAAGPVAAARLALAYWTRNALNALADRDALRDITRRINGGLIGIDDRAKKLMTAKRVLRL